MPGRGWNADFPSRRTTGAGDPYIPTLHDIVTTAGPKLAIWGAGGHARVVADIVRQAGGYELVGFLDDVDPRRKGAPFCGSTVIGDRENFAALRAAGVEYIFLAVGSCADRLRMARVALDAGFHLAKLVHPRAVVAADCKIGPGSMIAANAVLNPGTVCGECVIVNTSSSIDHDCHLGDGAHVGPGACLGGGVSVGAAAWIGIGAVVSDHLSIGEQAVIGAGAVVVRDVPAGVVAYGVPARIIRPVVAT